MRFLKQKPVIKSVVAAIESFIKNIENKISEQKNKEKEANWHSLFLLFSNVAEGESEMSLETLIENNTDDYQNLTKFWQKRLQEQLALNRIANVEEREIKNAGKLKF